MAENGDRNGTAAEVIEPGEPSEQDLEILNKRALGHSTYRLAREFKMSIKEIHAALDRAIPKIDAEYARRELGVQLHLLDIMTIPIAEKARTGDPQSITALMRLAERRASVLGWDVAPSFRRDPVAVQIEQAKQQQGTSTDIIRAALDRIAQTRAGMPDKEPEPPTSTPH
jgi:hypothetical protein